MPGFSSADDFTLETSTNGKFFRQDWNKQFLPTSNAVAGEWNCLLRAAGNPPADTVANTGTNLAFQPLTDATAGAGGILHGGNVSPDYKRITAASAVSPVATWNPAWLMLVDLIGFYRVTSVTTTTGQSLTNTLTAFSTFTADASTDICTHTNINLFPFTRVRLTTSGTLPAGLATATDYFVIRVTDTTIRLATTYANAVANTFINITDAGTGTHTINTLLPRYTSGAGVQAFMWNTNATALGAATPNLSIGYTNAIQTGSRATPTVLPSGRSAAPNGHILYSGTGAGKYGPFMPLQGGDTGVAQADTVTISASYLSGEFSIGLCRPLFTIPIITTSVASERDLVNQLPSCPRVYDGAVLTWLTLHGGATVTSSALFGHIDFAWG